MGTTDKKYKFLIEYENFDITRNRRSTEYPVTYDIDNTKLKCTLDQAIQYAKDKLQGEQYYQAFIMSYEPNNYSYDVGVAEVSTIPLYIKKTADKLRLDIRKQEDFNYLKEKYKRIYNFVTETYYTFTPRSIDEFAEELEFDHDKSTIEFDDTEFFVCKGKFTDYTDTEQVKIISELQKQVTNVTGVYGLEDFAPRIYKCNKWKEFLFDYDETDEQHQDDNETEL